MATADKQVRVTGEQEISQVRRIPRSQIRRFPDQPRNFFDAKDMNDLAASIEEIGQQTPIVVKVVTGDPKHSFELVDGERRWIACGMANVDTMLAWVRPIADSDEQFIASVVGNFGRSGHTALEISQAVDRIRKSKRMQELSPGEQVARIAKIFARSEPWVYSHLAILRLHPDVQAMMAPMIPEEERLSHTLGVFISSLHQDLQLEIAKAVLAKKMSLNQARLYARQVAEEAGVKVGTNRGRAPGLPSQSWVRLKNMVRIAQEGLNALLVPAVQDALKKRDPADRAVMATELEQCIARLNQMRVILIEMPSTLEVECPRPVSIPASVVVDIRFPRKVKELTTPIAQALPPPLARKPVPTPNIPKEQSIELSHKVLSALFYRDGQPIMNLGRRRLQEELPDIDDLDIAVSQALRAAKNHWRITPEGPKEKQNLIRLMHRFRHNYGNCKEFAQALEHARKWDESDDPVSLHFKK